MGASSHRELTDRLAASLAEAFGRALRWVEVEGEPWTERPAPDRWSVAEICEHLTLVHRYLLILLEKIRDRARKRIAAGEVPDATPSRTDHLEAIATRDHAWAAPDHMVPTGRTTRGEIRGRLADDRRRCLELLREMPDGEGTLHRIRFSVVDDRLDLYQFLRVIDLHLRRHLAQMERARNEVEEGP